MKKKVTVLVVLISMCLIATVGIGAVSASDDPVGGVTVGIISPEGAITPIKTFESSDPIDVTMTRNEDGSMNISKNGIRVSEDELSDSLSLDKADALKPSEKIDAFAGRYLFYAYAENNQVGCWCYAGASCPSGGASAEASDGYCYCRRWC